VKPGHGVEFMGSRIIPEGLLADRDILLKLGYSENTDKSILNTREMVSKVESLQEWAYTNFVKELHFWLELGYDRDEVSAFLARIYREQHGGTGQVENDRKQRRKILRATLNRLKADKTEREEMRYLAESALTAL
jgi:hypothetical protein